MGIRLDWEIESEQNSFGGGEDPKAAKNRRRLRFRLLVAMTLVFMLVGAIVALVLARIDQIQQEDESLLRATVDAEVAALRIGNLNAFLDIQRSATQAWYDRQELRFESYQELKLNNEVRLTGQIHDVTIEDQRARVKVEEVIDGVPYTQVWFYWRYDPLIDETGEEIEPGGWFHVPPDYTFWGDTNNYESQRVLVNYREVDAPLAESMGTQINDWLTFACAGIDCSGLPQIAVSIEVNDALNLHWAEMNPWQLRVPSPFMDRARSDMPFSPEMRVEVAALLAERLVAHATGNLEPIRNSDTDFLRQAVIMWMVGQFTQINTESFLIASLANQYSITAVGQLLNNLQADSRLSILGDITGTPSLDQMPLDWRDFLTWRLNVENERILAGDYNGLLTLYAPNSPDIEALVRARFDQVVTLADPVVVLVQGIGATENGAPRLLATVQTGAEGTTSQQEIIFSLIDGTWKRVN